ncbi:uncharacterized protein LOC143099555 [Alosa pseudoharengus]|uniref:uncharacterized protein LOC143099555 n=1 Tax=Alosa pseudoharengus TaxID=34774 RepID=UPI003F88760E
MVIGIRLLTTTLFCGAVMSAPVPAHQSTGSVTPEDPVEVPLEQSDSSVSPKRVMKVVPLGKNVVLSCKPPGSLAESCISVQTKDTREKEPSPLFVTGPEKKVELHEQVLLYLMKGQEMPEFQSPLYRNRTSRWDGGDVSVELWNVSVSDNNTIFHFMTCPHCRKCVIQCEITLRITEERGEGGKGNPTVTVTAGVNQNPTVTVTTGGNENPTVTVTAVVVPVLLLLLLLLLVGAIVVGCVCIRRKCSKSAAGANQDATEGGAMGAVETGVMGRPTEESVGNQDQPDGPVVMTKDQPNGPVVMTEDQPDGPVVMTEDQPNGSTIKDQDQPNGSTTYLKNQQQQSGSAESTAAPEQEPLLRNKHSRGEDGRGGQSDQDRALSEQETCL